MKGGQTMKETREEMCLNKVKECVLKNQVKHDLSPEDFLTIKEIIFEAVRNPMNSKFPDFILDFAIIEHFRVTSSKETAKGAKDAVEKFHFSKKCEKELKELVEETADVAAPNEMRVMKKKMDCPEYRYEYFVASVEKNIERHIASLRKYNKSDKKVVFLMEYEGLIFPIMKTNEFVDFYDLQKDEKLLLYIYQFGDLIDYIVFYDQTECEFIKVEDMFKLSKNVPKEIWFESGKLKYFNISILLDF